MYLSSDLRNVLSENGVSEEQLLPIIAAAIPGIQADENLKYELSVDLRRFSTRESETYFKSTEDLWDEMVGDCGDGVTNLLDEPNTEGIAAELKRLAQVMNSNDAEKCAKYGIWTIEQLEKWRDELHQRIIEAEGEDAEAEEPDDEDWNYWDAHAMLDAAEKITGLLCEPDPDLYDEIAEVLADKAEWGDAAEDNACAAMLKLMKWEDGFYLSEYLAPDYSDFFESLGYWTVYWYTGYDLDLEAARAAGLDAFEYDGTQYLALGGCGMDLSPKLDAYQALVCGSLPESSQFIRQPGYAKSVVGEETFRRVMEQAALAEPQLVVHLPLSGVPGLSK